MFLPIGDDNPHTKLPIVNYTIIAICVAVFLWQVSLPGNGEEVAVLTFGLVPGDLLGLSRTIDRPSAFITMFTSMFMHGGFMHLAGNMLYLWIFGDNIEASLGSFRYLVFYLLCGVAAALAQIIAAPDSMVPMIGASGAISGVMGAYMMLHPRANIRVFVWIIIYFSVWNVPAIIVLGFWIGGQLLSSMNVDPSEPGIAFMAHIGGFIAGAILVFFFKKRDVRVFEPAYTKPFAHYERPIRIRRGGSVPRSGGPRGPWN
ncbi:MAG: rhomboid family intramembrane serine protease [Rhodospirillaceae bacterium]|nr:rhomboid family intramembrane serine protease [Rhodospirillaceae bacterium]